VDKFKIITPNANFDGRRYGVEFKNGIGQADLQQAIVLVFNFGYSSPEFEKTKEYKEIASRVGARDKSIALQNAPEAAPVQDEEPKKETAPESDPEEEETGQETDKKSKPVKTKK
jgi:hypothetical protein